MLVGKIIFWLEDDSSPFGAGSTSNHLNRERLLVLLGFRESDNREMVAPVIQEIPFKRWHQALLLYIGVSSRISKKWPSIPFPYLNIVLFGKRFCNSSNCTPPKIMSHVP